jgi:DNA (cytosine-5)-methyltransferase 1
LNELALFAGAGGGILGGKLLGWRTVCAVEWEKYPASVLLARQNDGILPPFPIWDDVQTFDGRPWQGIVDVISGGFPCQDISAAGKGAGIDGERSGMWKEMARIICEVRPKFVFVENSPMLTHRGLDRVLADLAQMGFDAEWGVLGAANVGAPHLRERIWIVAHSESARASKNERGLWSRSEGIDRRQTTNKKVANSGCELRDEGNTGELVANTTKRSASSIHNQSSSTGFDENVEYTSIERYKPQKEQIRTRGNSVKHTSWWEIEPDVGRVAHGVAAGVDRLKAIGNGQVSEVARTAWNELMERLHERL